MTVQLSQYAQQQQATALADIIRVDGQLRLYEGEQRPLDQRTDGRLVSCQITSVTVEGGTITVTWDQATVTKEGNADFYRITTGNIPVMSGSIPKQMEMSDRALKVNMVVDSGTLTHTVFSE